MTLQPMSRAIKAPPCERAGGCAAAVMDRPVGSGAEAGADCLLDCLVAAPGGDEDLASRRRRATPLPTWRLKRVCVGRRGESR